jgi:hypothetical protein
METPELYRRYPGLNPAVWRQLMFPGERWYVSAPVSGVPGPGEVSRIVKGAFEQTAGKGPRRRNSDFALPCGYQREDGVVEFPEQERAGASSKQLQKTSEMFRLGLLSKARRQASCAVYARRRSCENGHDFFQRYYCKNRYCPNPGCGSRLFFDLFDKYAGLELVANFLAPDWENRPRRKPHPGEFVMAKLDITTVNTGWMPTSEEIRQFNRDVRKLFRMAEKEWALRYPKRAKREGKMVPERTPYPGDYGVIWTDEFGGKATRPGRVGNTNLHAHAIYCGPCIPHDWWCKAWGRIRSDGSRRVGIKVARSFRAGLYHSLKYAGKFLTDDPMRLAELELAFNRVRRVHTMGAFYNAVPPQQESPKFASPCCPQCGGAMFDPSGPLCSVRFLELTGARDFEMARREAGRARVFQGVSDG